MSFKSTHLYQEQAHPSFIFFIAELLLSLPIFYDGISYDSDYTVNHKKGL